MVLGDLHETVTPKQICSASADIPNHILLIEDRRATIAGSIAVVGPISANLAKHSNFYIESERGVRGY